MLFYNQLKREFLPLTWKLGQNLFLAKKIAAVRMTGQRVIAKIDERDISITVARGTILHSHCACRTPAPPAGSKHCEHAAALCIWVVERGSLIRAGIADENEGIDTEGLDADESEETEEGDSEGGPARSAPGLSQKRAPARKTPAQKALPDMIPSEGIAYVRGIFEDRKLTAISVEPAIRYKDPDTEEVTIKTLQYLTRKPEYKAWKTPQGALLKLSHENVAVLGTMDAAKIVYQGRAALESLARFLTHPQKAGIGFHPEIELEVDPEPLQLKKVHIGRQVGKSRSIEFLYQSARYKFDSEKLAQLSQLGRLSDTYVWHEKKLLRLSPSLHQVYQYANRTGVAALEGNEAQVKSHTGFAYLHDDEESPLHPLAVFRLTLELGVADFSVDTEWKEFQAWQTNFNKKRIPKLPNTDFGFDLRDYQKNGVSWMWSLYHRGLAALLADDMGLGKTHQVLAFLKCVYEENPKHPPTLVVAPTSVVAAWKQKLEKYPTGLKWTVFHGNARSLPNDGVHIVLTTYGILQREAALRTRRWHLVVMDEAQAIKNASTISSRAARTLKCAFRIAMTGTPVENQSSDLWSIMEFLLPGYLGSLPRFKRLYGAGREIPTADQAAALKRLVSPFLLRRTKTQVLKELPEKTEEIIRCELTTAQKKAYRAALESSEAERLRVDIEKGGRINYVNVLSLLTRLKQICDHPKLADYVAGRVKKASSLKPDESGKWETVEELIQEALRSDLKVVVFTQYLGMMDLLGHVLKEQGVGFTELRGDTRDRQERIAKFQTEPDCRVFICSLLAGGLGIDLTAASVCIHLDRWWNPAKENQATDRLHRFGQTRGVQVFKLQTEETVEERIAQIIESKLGLSNALIEESAASLKAFSRDELLSLLRLPAGF
jgi:superfamily II DNA or RNA helicase